MYLRELKSEAKPAIKKSHSQLPKTKSGDLGFGADESDEEIKKPVVLGKRGKAVSEGEKEVKKVVPKSTLFPTLEDEETLKKAVETYESELGFTKVMQILRKAKKPIVGHHMMMDTLFLFNQFHAKLPDTFSEFRQQV